MRGADDEGLCLPVCTVQIFNALVKWGEANEAAAAAGGAGGGPAAAASAVGSGGAMGLKARLAPLLVHVRFPLIDGQKLAELVEPSGLVDDKLLFEAYRYHASGVKIDGNPRFVPRRPAGAAVAGGGVGGAPVASNMLGGWQLSLPGGPCEC